MTEAKYELKNWKKWKRTVQLLEETRDQLKDMKKGINIDSSSMPGTGHTTIMQKMNMIIEECDKYDVLIERYNFLINRLERSIAEFLTKEQREVCIIYANNRNSALREKEALIRGYPQATFYRLLKESFNELNNVLKPFDSNLIVNNVKNVL